MNKIVKSLLNNVRGAQNTFKTFPVVIISAMLFTLVTIIQDPYYWTNHENLKFIFSSLHLSLAASISAGLFLNTYVQSKFNTFKSFLYANVFSGLVGILTFFLLFFLGKVIVDVEEYGSNYVSILAQARVMVFILLCLLSFLYIIGKKNNVLDLSKALIVSFKALCVASVFGIIMMLGFSAIASSIQALLYNDMSYRVYTNLGALSLFIAFTIFLGYFPSYKKNEVDSSREFKETQPIIIEMLLQFILLPIILVLTSVLLIWTLKILFTGNWPEFSMISGIVMSYAFFGLLLSIIVSNNKNKIVSIYKIVYPVASIIIFSFGLWGFVKEINNSGLKTDTYFFLVIWFIAMLSVILLLLKKERSHNSIMLIVALFAIFSILPLVNYKDLPVSMQINRLEGLLTDAGMFKNNTLTALDLEITLDEKIKITDSVNYLAYEREANLPSWFNKDFGQGDYFEKVFGFQQIWQEEDRFYSDQNYIYLTSDNTVLHIKNYDWALNFGHNRGSDKSNATLQGDKGQYEFKLNYNEEGIPELKVNLDDELIMDIDLENYLNDLSKSIKLKTSNESNKRVDNLEVSFESEELLVLITFNEISITRYDEKDGFIYYVNMNMIYIMEKN